MGVADPAPLIVQSSGLSLGSPAALVAEASAGAATAIAPAATAPERTNRNHRTIDMIPSRSHLAECDTWHKRCVVPADGIVARTRSVRTGPRGHCQPGPWTALRACRWPRVQQARLGGPAREGGYGEVTGAGCASGHMLALIMACARGAVSGRRDQDQQAREFLAFCVMADNG